MVMNASLLMKGPPWLFYFYLILPIPRTSDTSNNTSQLMILSYIPSYMRVNLNIIENKMLAVHCIICLCLEDKIFNKPHYCMTKMQISVA